MNMFAIFRKELHVFFGSLMAYITIGVFTLFMGVCLWVFPGMNILDGGYADMSLFFDVVPYIFAALIPAVTMSMFSEEYQNGTMELLLASPVSVWQIVLGKFFAAMIILGIILILTTTYVVSIYYLASPMGNIDIAAIIGSYIGLFLLSMAYTALGLFSSSLTKRQIVAFVIGTSLCLIAYQAFDMISFIAFCNEYSMGIQQVGFKYHYNSLNRGLIDMKDVIYFLLVTNLELILVEYIVKYKNK